MVSLNLMVVTLAVLLFGGVVTASRFESYVKPGWSWNGWSAPQHPQQGSRPPCVSFFQNRYCQGNEYTVPIGHGECQTLPKQLCDWNLSLKTHGSCIQVFENAFCQENRGRSLPWGLSSSKVFKTNQCSSTKLNGFDVVRSFRRCAC